MTSHNKDFMDLVSWIRANGGTISNIGITNSTKEERGVYSRKTIRNNTKVIKIPKTLIIHDGLGQVSYYGKELLRGNHADINNLQIALVVIFMLDDMRKDSSFLPYYKILPKQLKTFPIFWNERTLSLLKGSYMLNKIAQRKENFRQDYDVITRCCPTFKDEYSFQDFLFLRLLVGSRNFGIRIDGIKRVAMIPFSDMLNHDPDPNISWFYDSSKDMFIMRANRIIRTMMELTDTYGNKCNSQLLLYYGFALPHNNANTIKLELRVPSPRTRSESKKYDLYPYIDGELKRNLNDQFTQDLLVFLRIMLATDEELSRFPHRTNYIAPISISNELKMLKTLGDYMEKLSRQYILKNDKVTGIINSIDRGTPEYLALVLVKGELDIIDFYRSFVRTVLSQLKKGIKPSNKLYSKYNTVVIESLCL